MQFWSDVVSCLEVENHHLPAQSNITIYCATAQYFTAWWVFQVIILHPRYLPEAFPVPRSPPSPLAGIAVSVEVTELHQSIPSFFAALAQPHRAAVSGLGRADLNCSVSSR